MHSLKVDQVRTSVSSSECNHTLNITHQVFKTFEKEFRTSDANILKPLERIEVEEGYATKDEVDVIVANRSGGILSASTMLKSDLFTNLQKVCHLLFSVSIVY